jgi:Polyketide cyclase / dehydrase and lipid transport
MNWLRAEASHVIDARPEQVYAVLSDYRVGHPAVLPRPYFTDLIVEKGGQGAGTVVRGSVKLFGKEFPFHQLVSEPEPGRILLETDIETGQWSTFTFEPLNGGTQTRLTIASEFPPSRGIMGLVERLTKASVIRRLYKQELRNIAAYVHSTNAAVSAR